MLAPGCAMRMETRGCSRGRGGDGGRGYAAAALNAPLVANQLGYPDRRGSSSNCSPSCGPRGSGCDAQGPAEALDLAVPDGDDAVPLLLQRAAALLRNLRGSDWAEREGA